MKQYKMPEWEIQFRVGHKIGSHTTGQTYFWNALTTPGLCTNLDKILSSEKTLLDILQYDTIEDSLSPHERNILHDDLSHEVKYTV